MDRYAHRRTTTRRRHRVAIRKTGSFNITTANGTVQGIHHRHCRILQYGDGWNYHHTEEETAHATKH